MKSYREIADSVFARREQYIARQRKKKQLVARATVSVSSVALVALVGVGLFKNDVFRAVLPISDGSSTTTTVTVTTVPADALSTTTSADATHDTTGEQTTDSTHPTATQTQPTATQTQPTVSQTKPTATQTKPTTLPTTPTVPQKIVITADEPDTYDLGLSEMPLKEYPRISPALQDKMKTYSGVDVLYSVIVEVLVTNEQGEYINNLPYNNAELLQLAEEREIAYQEFVDAKEQYGWTEDVLNKQSVYKDIARQYSQRLEKLKNEYFSLFIDVQLKAFYEWSNQTPIPLSTDTRFYPIFASDPNHAFFMDLTADEINELAKHDGYRIRLVFPGGDPVLVLPE